MFEETANVPKKSGFHLDFVSPSIPCRQGNDRGTQYRSGIYYHSEEQKVPFFKIRRHDPTLLSHCADYRPRLHQGGTGQVQGQDCGWGEYYFACFKHPLYFFILVNTICLNVHFKHGSYTLSLGERGKYVLACRRLPPEVSGEGKLWISNFVSAYVFVSKLSVIKNFNCFIIIIPGFSESCQGLPGSHQVLWLRLDSYSIFFCDFHACENSMIIILLR